VKKIQSFKIFTHLAVVLKNSKEKKFSVSGWSCGWKKILKRKEYLF
jgi:hypothetical protein